MAQTYFTVAGEGIGTLTEKKSRFIATVCPVTSSEQAMQEIEKLRSKYWDARHNVYAYTLLEGQIKRYSDDGEPSGTAGIPILNVLEKMELQNVLVVVTRYFGGILLGTGGLIRAYGQAAKNGIENAGIVQRCLCNIIAVSCSYTQLGKIEKFAQQQNIKIKDILYTDKVCVYLYQKLSETEKLLSQLTELTDAQASCEIIGQAYIGLDVTETI